MQSGEAVHSYLCQESFKLGCFFQAVSGRMGYGAVMMHLAVPDATNLSRFACSRLILLTLLIRDIAHDYRRRIAITRCWRGNS